MPIPLNMRPAGRSILGASRAIGTVAATGLSLSGFKLVKFELIGASGGSGKASIAGGPGGLTGGALYVPIGTVLTVAVPAGGTSTSTRGGGGGGFAGLFIGAMLQANALAIAAGGGGASAEGGGYPGGAGGGLIGADGYTAGTGGTQSAGGISAYAPWPDGAGTALQGGHAGDFEYQLHSGPAWPGGGEHTTSNTVAGGGGGYFGGGAGGVNTNDRAGGGGSGFIAEPGAVVGGVVLPFIGGFTVLGAGRAGNANAAGTAGQVALTMDGVTTTFTYTGAPEYLLAA